MRIAIDIGHANKTGAVGNGLEEHEEAKGIAKELKSLLEGRGDVVFEIDFPELSNKEDLRKTIERANSLTLDFGISLHCDCSGNALARGSHAIYYPTSRLGKKLSDAIGNELSKILKGRADTSIPRKNLAVLKETRCPWILIECGFLTNKHDAKIIKNNKREIATAILNGINDIF